MENNLAILNLAKELAARYNAQVGEYEMEAVHDTMKAGAKEEDFAHTGGNIWLSYTTHEVGGRVLLASAGDDSLAVFLLPRRVTHLPTAISLLNDLCGEDDAWQVLFTTYEHPEPVFNEAAKVLLFGHMVETLRIANTILQGVVHPSCRKPDDGLSKVEAALALVS